jgi:iron complex outermembrane receptor protein
MMRVLRFVLALAAVVLTASAASAQTSYITGSVTDAVTSAGIGSAQISLRTASGSAIANTISGADGSYRINAAPVGTYTISVRAISYAPASQQVTVIDGAPSIVSFQLEPQGTRLDVVTVTGGRGVPQKATDDPGSTFAVEEVEINTRAAITPTDHVMTVPGVDVVKTGLLQSNVVTRGFNNIFSGSLLTLTDYRFAFVPSLRVNVPYLSPTTNEDIARIEMVLGPAAALYGPNSAHGVMHIITKSPFESQGTTLTLDAGNRSVLRTAVRHAGAPSERFGYKVSFERFTGNDWESVDDVELNLELPDGTPAPVQRDFDLEKMGGEVRLDFRPRPGMDIIATAGRAIAVSAIEPTGLGGAQVKDWVFDAYQLRASQGRLFGQIFFNTSDAGDTFILRNRNNEDRGVIVDKSRQFVGQLQHGFGFGGVSMGAPSAVDAAAAEVRDRFDVIYGLDYQLTNPRTEGTINGRNEENDNVTEFGGYFQARTRITRLIDLVGALRVDDHSRTPDLQWSPRAAVIFHPTENQAVRLTYNRAFSPPSTNNLFLDLVGGSIVFSPTSRFDIRTVGTPTGGLSFRRDCAGGAGGATVCMRSPFDATGAARPVDARPFFGAAVAVASANSRLRNALIGLASLTPTEADNVIARLGTISPAADGPNVGTQLRVFNPTTRQFAPAPATLRDIAAIEPSITNSYEIGYKGFIADRLSLTIDVWRQRRENFVGPLTVETPNAFLDAATLGAYVGPKIADLFPGAAAAKIPGAAAVIGGALGGVANNDATGVPLGVVFLDNEIAGPTDIILAYRNFGTVDLTGADLGSEFIITPGLSVAGTYSWADKDYFRDVGGDQDIALNAPAGKGSLTGRFNTTGGFSAELRNRWVRGFPAVSGVYICNEVTDACPEGKIPSYSLLDAQVSLRPSLFPNVMITVTGTNMLDKEHQTFAGGATIGRLIMTRLQYTF